MIAQLALLGIASAAPPRLEPSLVEKTTAALDRLRAIDAPPTTRAAIGQAERAMRQIRRGLDAYFHASNLLAARPAARAMRDVFRRLRADPQPIVTVVDDVLRFDARLHDHLAAACEVLRDARCARRHRMDALISAPTSARRSAARALVKPRERPRFDARFKAAAAPSSTPE